MKERPILMTPENAQKCHDGTKTQTRRIVKRNASGRVQSVGSPRNWHLEDPNAVLACPYGIVGDRLWVREAWAWPGEEEYLYKGRPADVQLVTEWQKDLNCCQVKWMPSIYMPRQACRTVLEITDVRVERLQSISDADALAEGVTVRPDAEIAARVAGPPETGARMEFFALWESINGKGSWALNPWVWVIEFRKVSS